MTEPVTLKRALISVSDKEGLIPFAQALAKAGIDLLSTGGTATLLRDKGIAVRDVADLTGFPEMMDGRVKTLHPKVHGGLLADRSDIRHQVAMDGHGILPIDLLVVNLYPFEDTVARGAGQDETVENIDIGGPAMIRAAAKNHAWVTVVTDPEDYDALLEQIETHEGATDLEFRRRMAATAYARTAAYDAAVAAWFAQATDDHTPRRHSIGGTRAQTLRYGENPHQRGAFYRDGSMRPGVGTATQMQGKELSWNNFNDTDAAFELVCEFPPGDAAACAIVKHANPCGVATGASLRDAYRRAFDCDRTSAFGGVIALNRPLDAATASEISEVFTEVVIAPSVEPAAAKILSGKTNLRLLTTGSLADPRAPGRSLRQVAGGFLVQDRDAGTVTRDDLRVVTRRAPDDAQIADLLFAWTVARHVKSNAIVYAKGGATVGIGAGQMSRVDSAAIAARKANDMYQNLVLPVVPTTGSVVASDAFFPFADGLLTAIEAGAVAVIQPGGSVRDDEVIAAADEAGIAMVFTGMRHFRH